MSENKKKSIHEIFETISHCLVNIFFSFYLQNIYQNIFAEKYYLFIKNVINFLVKIFKPMYLVVPLHLKHASFLSGLPKHMTNIIIIINLS